MKQVLFFIFCTLILTSCVSKKKHKAEVQLLKRVHQDTLTTVSNRLKRQVRLTQDTVSMLRLDLAERKGENNVLNTLRGELAAQIKELESQIETLSNNSQSNQSNLNNTLAKKEKEIAALQLQLKTIDNTLTKRQEAFKKIASDFLYTFQEMPFSEFDLQTTDQGLRITFPKEVFFRKGTTSSIQKKGISVMEKSAEVLNRYPQMQLTVVGHTNNSTKGQGGISNNWSLSALQAAEIVYLFADEYNVITSQLTASGKGEFQPKASNETTEGKAANDRIEWIIRQQDEDLEREIRKVLGGN
jgi:chemotaxis protein MotB